MIRSTSDFKLVFLPLASPKAEHKLLYQQAAEVWYDVWQKVNENFKVEKPLFLDSLLRQDEAACIFSPQGCVGMLLFRTLDFAILDYRRDSYFKEWTELDLAKLLKHGKNAFLSSHLTVHPSYRGFHPDIKFKEVLLDIMILRFLQSNADVISGITRRDRAINDISFALGATLVRENVAYFDGREHVDLVAFYRKDARRSQNPHVHTLVDQLWNGRLDLTHGKALQRVG